MSVTQNIKKVRMDFENRRIDVNRLKRLYQEYNPIDNIQLFISSAKKMFPHLNCGLASVYLKSLFPNSKIINGKFNGHNHTFLKINDVIIDITSDQYDGPKVYVGELKQPWSF